MILHLTRTQVIDMAERMVATFLQSVLATLTTNSFMDLGVDQWKMVALSGFTAALSALKSALATRLGDGSASLAPPPRY